MTTKCLVVDYDYGTVVDEREQHGESEWDYSWRTEYDFNLVSAKIHPDTGQKVYTKYNTDVIVNYTGSPGDEVFVVVMRYTDGDSFGTSSGHADVIGTFTSAALAAEQAAMIEMYHVNGRTSPMFIPFEYHKDGKVNICYGTYYSAADGYFNNLTGIEIYKMVVTNETQH